MEMEAWLQRWEELVTKWDQLGYQSLTEDERIWFNLRSIIDAVNDGGVISFYYNSGAEYMEETKEDLKKLGFTNLSKALDRINKLFPNGEVPKDIEERNKIIDSWDEEGQDYSELFDAIDEKFYEADEKLETKIEPIIERILRVNG